MFFSFYIFFSLLNYFSKLFCIYFQFSFTIITLVCIRKFVWSSKDSFCMVHTYLSLRKPNKGAPHITPMKKMVAVALFIPFLSHTRSHLKEIITITLVSWVQQNSYKVINMFNAFHLESKIAGKGRDLPL